MAPEEKVKEEERKQLEAAVEAMTDADAKWVLASKPDDSGKGAKRGR